MNAALMLDTFDRGLLSDKKERRGTYFSINILMIKAQVALGASLGLALAGWLSFDATATTHNESSAFAIHLAISWIQAVILTIGFFYMTLFIRRTSLRHYCAAFTTTDTA